MIGSRKTPRRTTAATFTGSEKNLPLEASASARELSSASAFAKYCEMSGPEEVLPEDPDDVDETGVWVPVRVLAWQ